MSKKSAVVAGHICLDLTPKFPENSNNRSAAENIGDILSPGKLLRVGEVDIHTGGSVANTGLAMKILGADVRLMGKVGNDDFGDTVCRILGQYDAGDGLIVSDNSSTSYSVVVAIPGFDRIFLHNPGANDTFSYDDIDWEAVDNAALFHFGYPPIMARMYENEGDELLRIFMRAKESGTITSLDLAAVDPSTGAGKVNWGKILQKIMPYVDFFVPSAEELCWMMDREMFDRWSERAAGGDITEVIEKEEIELLAEKVLSLGAKLALIKCGAAGMYYRSGGIGKMKKVCDILEVPVEEWNYKAGFERCYVPEKIISGTGAGDTSIAAFLTAALNKEPLEMAVHLAAATGACCVASYDALSGLRPLDELKEKIRSGWEKSR